MAVASMALTLRIRSTRQFIFSSNAFQNTPPRAVSGYTSYGVVDHNATGFYRRTFNMPADWSDKRVFLHFDGVYSAAVVWLNGKYVGY